MIRPRRELASHPGGSPVPLQLEVLEHRLTPATYRWQPLLFGDTWTTAANWRVEDALTWVPTSTTPGAEDDVQFWGTYNSDCIIPGNQIVKSLQIYAANGETGGDYTATITIQGSLRVDGPAGSFIGSPATLAGGGSDSQLIVGPASDLSWRAGTLRNLTVEVAHGGILTVAGSTNGPNLSMDLTGITVSGTLKWTNGNVTTRKSAPPGMYVPKIQINTGASFEISAGGRR